LDIPPFPCPVCGSPFNGRIIVHERSVRGETGIQACSACGLHITWPRLPDPQGEYHKEDRTLWERKYGAIAQGARLHDRHANYLEEVALLQRLVPGGRVLDVGCNAGWLLGYLQQAGGFTPEGLEPGTMLAEITRERLGVPVHNTTLQALQNHDGAFDALIATDVIEHVLPEEALTFAGAAARLLRPGGLILVKTPNRPYTSAKSELIQLIPPSVRRWIILGRDVWDSKEHVIHWDPRALARLFARCGFESVMTFVPRPVQTAGSPALARLLRATLYRAALLAGGRRRVPFFAQDIFFVARKTT